jgi:hypothetical protein
MGKLRTKRWRAQGEAGRIADSRFYPASLRPLRARAILRLPDANARKTKLSAGNLRIAIY